MSPGGVKKNIEESLPTGVLIYTELLESLGVGAGAWGKQGNPGHCKMFRSIPGPLLTDENSTAPQFEATKKNICRHSSC